MLALGAAALAGCAHRDSHMSYNPTGFKAPDELPVSQTLMTYHLGAGDVVTINVFSVESLSGDRQVDAAGNINMPLIGPVPAADKTTQELETALTTKFGARYLQNPQVTVVLKTAVERNVTVEGSVTQPGLYPVASQTTLLKTIAMAHGTSVGANPKKVVVFRQIDGHRNVAAFDLTTIRNGIDPDPVIYANDIVVVDGRQTDPAWTQLIQTVPLIALFTRLY